MAAYKILELRTDRVPTLIKAAIGAAYHPNPHEAGFDELVELFHDYIQDNPVTELGGWVACSGGDDILLWDRDPTIGRTQPMAYSVPALAIACPVCGGALEPTPSQAMTCREHGSEHFRCEADEPLLERLLEAAPA